MPGCLVYTQDLIDSAEGDSVTSSGGADDGSGGSSKGSGGSRSGGDSGDGDGDSGGSRNDADGGSNPGGAGNHDGSGGDSDEPSGGSGSGGASPTGGTGSGGGPSVCSAETAPCLVDDFDHVGSANYNSPPFLGKWDRYIQGPDAGAGLAAFTASATKNMFIEDPDDAENGILHIAATEVDDWGLGMFVTLGGKTDLSGYKGISFKARSGNDESVINVALADENSHQSPCLGIDDGVDCDKHMRSVDAPEQAIGADWFTVELPLAGFWDKQENGVDRSSDLNLKAVYAIHFQIMPDSGTDVDFYIDDLVLY